MENKKLTYLTCCSVSLFIILLVVSFLTGSPPKWIKISTAVSGLASFLLLCTISLIKKWKETTADEKVLWLEKPMRIVKYAGWVDGILFVGTILYYGPKEPIPDHGRAIFVVTLVGLFMLVFVHGVMGSIHKELLTRIYNQDTVI